MGYFSCIRYNLSHTRKANRKTKKILLKDVYRVYYFTNKLLARRNVFVKFQIFKKGFHHSLHFLFAERPTLCAKLHRKIPFCFQKTKKKMDKISHFSSCA